MTNAPSSRWTSFFKYLLTLKSLLLLLYFHQYLRELPYSSLIVQTFHSPLSFSSNSLTVLGTLIPILGVQYSFLHPTSTYVIFVTIDVVSLTIQAIGGGIASSADTLAGANQGGYIMAGGVL